MAESSAALVAFADHVGGGDFDAGLTPEKLQQHLHPFAGGHDTRYHSLQAAKGSGGDFDFLADGQRGGDGMKLFGADRSLKFGNDIVRNGGPAIAKMNNPTHAGRMVHLAEELLKIEPGEKVAGEKRLGEPGDPTDSFPLKADARQKNRGPRDLAHALRSEVFALGLRPEAEPVVHEFTIRVSHFAYRSHTRAAHTGRTRSN